MHSAALASMIVGILALIGLGTVMILGTAFTAGIFVESRYRFCGRLEEFFYRIERGIVIAFRVGVAVIRSIFGRKQHHRHYY